MIQLKDLMSKKLSSISVDASLEEADQIMREKRIRHLPVVDDTDGVVGIISSKDIPADLDLKKTSVEFYMSTPVVYVNKETSIKFAIYKMLEKKISSLIVTDDDDGIAGILTTDDLLWYLVTKLEKDNTGNGSFINELLDADTLGKVAHQISMTGI